MKLLKRAARILALTTAVSGSVSCVYAGEMGKEIARSQVVKVLADSQTTTGSGVKVDEDAPVIKKVYTEVRNSKTYLMISVTDATGIRYVKVDGESADRYSGDKKSAIYSYQITSSDTYDIDVCDELGNSDSTSKKITLNTKKPSLSLSQTYKNGKYYLVIKASDDGKIKKVTVDGKEISFSESGETKEYQVTKEGKYTVVVTDDVGNETTDKYTITMDISEPNLKLSKEYKNKKWYLIIKTSPANSNKLSKITVNGKSISSFNAKGDTISYEVSSNGTYKVVVKDDLDKEASASLYINVSELPDEEGPSLSLSQMTTGGTNLLIITVKDNDILAKVTVNGTEVNVSSSGGTIRYQVPSAGSYTVIATDANGNETKKTINITESTASTTASVNQVVKFKLNDKNWTKNGVEQEMMDMAPVNKNGRIYLPLRFAAYALNIDSSKITWDSKQQAAIIYDGSSVIKVTVGSKTMLVNGSSMTMDAAALCQNGRVLLPISQVSKAFKGMNLSWDNTSKEITITKSN